MEIINLRVNKLVTVNMSPYGNVSYYVAYDPANDSNDYTMSISIINPSGSYYNSADSSLYLTI